MKDYLGAMRGMGRMKRLVMVGILHSAFCTLHCLGALTTDAPGRVPVNAGSVVQTQFPVIVDTNGAVVYPTNTQLGLNYLAPSNTVCVSFMTGNDATARLGGGWKFAAKTITNAFALITNSVAKTNGVIWMCPGENHPIGGTMQFTTVANTVTVIAYGASLYSQTGVKMFRMTAATNTLNLWGGNWDSYQNGQVHGGSLLQIASFNCTNNCRDMQGYWDFDVFTGTGGANGICSINVDGCKFKSNFDIWATSGSSTFTNVVRNSTFIATTNGNADATFQSGSYVPRGLAGTLNGDWLFDSCYFYGDNGSVSMTTPGTVRFANCFFEESKIVGPTASLTATGSGEVDVNNMPCAITNLTVSGNVRFTGGNSGVYRALISQTGTGAPTVTVRENTLKGAIVWTRTGAGAYVGTLSGAFTGTTFCFLTPDSATKAGWGFSAVSANAVNLDTFVPSTGTLTDGLLTSASLAILVYP